MAVCDFFLLLIREMICCRKIEPDFFKYGSSMRFRHTRKIHEDTSDLKDNRIGVKQIDKYDAFIFHSNQFSSSFWLQNAVVAEKPSNSHKIGD